VIRVFDKRKPNVKSLARKGDVDGLIQAASHSEVIPGADGTPVDVGAAIREEALFALRDVAPDRAGNVFVTALADPSDRVRCAAVVALYERGDAEQLAVAVAKLPASAGKARTIATRALFELRRPESSARLAHALVHRQDHYPMSEDDAALVTAMLRAEERAEAASDVVQLLVAALGDEREIVVERAEALLVRLGSASTDPLLSELSNGAFPHRAATLLAEIKDARALQPLVEALSHPDPRVRGQSCFALGELRDPAAVEPLLHATRDQDHRVRVLAGAALDGMGTAAVAVSVAALLRPMIGEALAGESVTKLLPQIDAAHAAERSPGKPESNGHATEEIRLDEIDYVDRIEVVWEGGAEDAP
jgi:HEAT repeat protein